MMNEYDAASTPLDGEFRDGNVGDNRWRYVEMAISRLNLIFTLTI